MKRAIVAVALCALLGQGAAAAPRVVFEDRFEGSLDAGWRWIRENPDAWRLEDGALFIRMEPGHAQTVKNALVRTAPDRTRGTFAVDVTLTHLETPTQQYEQAGITWYTGGRPVFKFVKELIDGKLYVFPGKIPMDRPTVQIRLVVSPEGCTALFRPDAEGEFQTAFTTKLPPPNNDEISIQGYHGPADRAHWVRFEDFRISYLKPVEPRVAFEDSFKESLGAGWRWIRENPDAWRIEDGTLAIRLEPGHAQTVKNALVRPAPDRTTGRFAIDVTLTSMTPPTEQYEQAGITWYTGGQPVFKFVKEIIDGKLYVIPGKIPMDRPTVQLRLVVSPEGCTAFFRPDAEGEFQTAFTTKLPPPNNDEVSIQGYHGPADRAHWVRFADFRILELERVLPPRPLLHPLFTDQMVLQRDTPVPVWGWTTPGTRVVLSCAGARAEGYAGDDGRWRATLPQRAAGGPHALEITAPERAALNGVLFGDVWICSGQSNMQWSVANSRDAKEEIAAADHPRLRLFTVPMRASFAPEELVAGQWLPCTPDTIPSFSAVGYYFGRELVHALDVPIGLINSSWGGTIAEAWTSAEALAGMEDFRAALDKFREQAAGAKTGSNPNIVTVLYNGMIAPLVPFAIKGAIWYQGESNAGRPEQYRRLLPTLIKDWRSRFGAGDFPFLVVQLANFRAPQKEPVEEGWAALREAQLLTAQADPKVGLAVITDIGEADDIHPRNKQDVGRRLALSALHIAHGREIVHSGPEYAGMQVDGGEARITFRHVGGGLVAKGADTLKGFAIAGGDGKFYRASARIDGDAVICTAPEVSAPVAVRYGWANNPDCNLFNAEGLPASPFRTDVP